MELLFNEEMLWSLAEMLNSPHPEDKQLARDMIKEYHRQIDLAFSQVKDPSIALRIVNAFSNIYKTEEHAKSRRNPKESWKP